MALIISQPVEQSDDTQRTLSPSPTPGRRRARGRRGKIAFFGWFGQGNFGNDITLEAMLLHLRRRAPDTEFTCITDSSNAVATAYGMTAVASRTFTLKGREPDDSSLGSLSNILVNARGEFRQWLYSIRVLRRVHALVMPGTGLLTDAYTLLYWGPYDLFRWSVAAKLCRCKLLFVSVGAGPFLGRGGRFFVKTALSLADYRSYRDDAARQQLEAIGFRAGKDPVYPDLAFSFPQSHIPAEPRQEKRRPVVGLGVMVHAGRYGVEKPADAMERDYLETLVGFADWLLAHEYDVRLLIGDLKDTRVTREFKSLLRNRLGAYPEDRIIDEPIESAQDLLEQLAATDVVVATRFHNVLLALLLNKPMIAISFHPKCASLMSDMGLCEYCRDINALSVDWLIERFSDLSRGTENVKPTIAERVEVCRNLLDQQYATVFKQIGLADNG